LLPFLILLTGCTPTRLIDAALVLQEFAAADGPSHLKKTTKTPLKQSVDYAIAGRSHHADLYLPGPLDTCMPADSRHTGDASRHAHHCPRAAIVVVPGAVPQGKDDPRLVAFATTLARAGFAVLAPEITGFRQLRIRPSDSREIADAFAYLVNRPELAPEGRAGIFAFSYAVGPALLAALEEDIREQVRFVVGLGGYHDLPRAMRFFTTGWYEQAGKWHSITPDDSGKMVLLYSSLDYLADGQKDGSLSDRLIFDQMVELRSRSRQTDLTSLATGLSSDGQAVYALAGNTDPERFQELFARLPAAMRADIERLNLARHDLKPLKARLILVHGRNDNLIPYPESLALAAAVPKGQASVFLIHKVLGHVDLNISTLFSWRFWSEDLPDLWRLWRVIDLLLGQRGELT
jgi:fermentation-respiration switch protein FrsA (DUF1100 family)